jgi:hypothetical protein
MDNTLLISMIMVVAIVIVIPVYINVTKKKQGRNKIEGNRNTQVTGENNTTNVTNINTQNNYSTPVAGEKKEPTADDVKARIKILFVDDKDDFPIIGMLRNNGYQVEYLDDIVDFEAKQVKYADIIFLDINGVGVAMKFKNQGMGLCGALRDYFGTTKKLILYSGETEGSIFDKDAKKADATLPKDSDLYQFTSYITQYGKELLEKVG